MTERKWIEKAIEGGWYKEWNPVFIELIKSSETHDPIIIIDTKSGREKIVFGTMIMSPLAWQAVARKEGWGEMPSGDIWQGKPRWQYNMHAMIDALCEGKSIEQ